MGNPFVPENLSIRDRFRDLTQTVMDRLQTDFDGRTEGAVLQSFDLVRRKRLFWVANGFYWKRVRGFRQGFQFPTK
jgi:hypothetical protein